MTNQADGISVRRAVALAIAGTTTGIAIDRYLRQRRLNRRIATAQGISGTVTIARSELGVPRIVAASRDDALFGLGYAMAGDRLWQMDLIRRRASGRLAEIAGPGELDSDRLMRLAGLGNAAVASLDHCSPSARSALDAVAAGVNHFMTHHPTPKEFVLAGYRPEPWTPTDSISIMLLMGWTLGGAGFQMDLFAERCRSVIGDEWTDAIFHGRQAEVPPSVRASVAFPPPDAPRHDAPIFPEGGFSNSWAVSGERSWTGAPLLAFDPHLEYTNPSVWYEAALEAPGFSVAGMTLCGLPGIGAGRNAHIAWGETAGMIVQSFLYREELDATGHKVRDGDEWVNLTLENHVIRVKGAQDDHLTIRRTPRGPLISDLVPEQCDGPVSLYWPGMEPTTEIDLLLAINQAGSVHDLAAGRHLGSVPCYNASVADSAGNIAQVVVGKIPIRGPRAGLLDPGDFPPSYIPADQMPLEINPDRGWVSGANTRLVDDTYPWPMYGVWESPHRMRRIASVLDSRPRHSPAGMRALQLDRFSLHASEIVPAMLPLMDGYPESWVLDELRNWDFVALPESRATALFEVFYTRWMKVSLLHRFPKEFVETGVLAGSGGSVPRDFCDKLLFGEYPAWFDGDEVRQRLARVAMDQALEWLRDRLGEDESIWVWGALNQLEFRHPLGVIPGPQVRRVNAGPYPMGGDRTTVWPTAWAAGDGYDVVGGPSMRLIMDMRHPELSWASNTLGEQGTPWKRHYRDQVDDFLSGRMHRLWPVDVSKRVVVIEPAGSIQSS